MEQCDYDYVEWSPTGSYNARRCTRCGDIVFRKFKCAACKQGTAGGNDPADCDYPQCGCDK